MAQRRVGVPYFANPPANYDRKYFSDLVRSFAQFAAITLNPGEDRATNIVLTNIPGSDSGLEVGTLFNFGGTVKIAEAHTAHPAGFGLTLGLGSVTVAIA